MQFGFQHGVHIRRIHYRIVSAESPVARPDGRGKYLNTASCWALLVNAARDARYLDLVPADAFIDRKAPPPIEHFAPQRDGYATLAGGHIIGLDEDFPEPPRIAFEGADYGPPVLVEIWAEKTTMNDVLVPIARRYGANLVTGTGEMSLTSTRNFVERVRAAGTPARILYVSDFDPAGRSMPVAVARKIEHALHQTGEALDLTLDPLVLTEAQCRDYRLPRTPIKESERRGAAFEARFGAGATELDALEALHPGELGRIVSAGVELHLDPDHKRRFNEAAGEHQAALDEITEKIHGQHADAIDDLRAGYHDLAQAFSKWQERAEAVFGRISDHLAESDVPNFCPPPMTERPPAPEPLFSSSRGYLDQIAAYRQWQGKGALE
ncbi:MAG: hypothetical protein H5U15_07565 [Roseovarius sp.]|nr:hypothetical protein [Roseovarius sp.]